MTFSESSSICRISASLFLNSFNSLFNEITSLFLDFNSIKRFSFSSPVSFNFLFRSSKTSSNSIISRLLSSMMVSSFFCASLDSSRAFCRLSIVSKRVAYFVSLNFISLTSASLFFSLSSRVSASALSLKSFSSISASYLVFSSFAVSETFFNSSTVRVLRLR